MENFTFYAPTYFAFGKDTENDTGKYVKRFDGDSGFSADLWNGNGAVPMGGCETVCGGVCVCDRAYPALHPDAGRPSDHPAEDHRGVDGIAASDDAVSFVSGI